ncbi:hypothetical protein BGZ83_008238 [Gryganskiella cystojenkinii]|nr:hypothetical protein BGZ83_008238 [Gryganskiella cystojenkinii]
MFNNSNYRDHRSVFNENEEKSVETAAHPEPYSDDELFYPPSARNEYPVYGDAAGYDSMDEYDIRPEDEDEAFAIRSVNVDGDDEDVEGPNVFRPSQRRHHVRFFDNDGDEAGDEPADILVGQSKAATTLHNSLNEEKDQEESLDEYGNEYEGQIPHQATAVESLSIQMTTTTVPAMSTSEILLRGGDSAVTIGTTAQSHESSSKNIQECDAAPDATATTVTAMHDETAKINSTPDSHFTSTHKRKRPIADTEEPKASSQRAKIIGAALAGAVVGSVGTIVALASM